MTTAASTMDRPWGLWLRQVLAVVRLELRRRLIGRRALGIYLIAALPAFPFVLRAIFAPLRHLEPVGETTMVYSIYYQTLLLRVVVFLGAVATFVNLFRGDELERVLHLYFLSPLRREVLAVAKYCAGVALCSIPFTFTVLVSFVAIYLPHGSAAIVDRLGDLAAYMGCIWLAVAGYGAVAMLLGILVKNAMLPVLLFWGWEWINPILPAALKRLSILFWVQSMMPVIPPSGPLAVIAEPAPAWVAIPSVIALIAVLVGLAALVIRRHEIRYAAD